MTTPPVEPVSPTRLPTPREPRRLRPLAVIARLLPALRAAHSLRL